MHINFSSHKRKTFRWFMLLGILSILSSASIGSPIARAQVIGTPQPVTTDSVALMPDSSPQEGHYSVRTITLADGTLVNEHTIDGSSVPPASFEVQRQAVDLSALSGPMIPDVPAYGWGGGCSPGASSMSLAYEDRTNFPNIYPKGVMPLLPIWGTRSDGFGIYERNPLSFSENGLDGKTTPGHIDDYWYREGFLTPEPYQQPPGRPEHTWDSLGDFMYTSQLKYNNADGVSKVYTLASPCTITAQAAGQACGILPRHFTSERAAYYNLPDGTLGIRRFYEFSGYAVAEAYNQPTDNVVAGGFSFAQYKAEIDAGWPVILQLGDSSDEPGHTITGIGYDAASNLIYFHDGWDYNTHSITWGTSYANMSLLMASIVHPIPPAHPGDYTVSGYVGVPNATITYTGGSTQADTGGYYSFSVAPGWSGRVTPSKPGYIFNPPYRDYTNIPAYQTMQNHTATVIPGSNRVNDPGFELNTPNPYWTESSTYFESVLCDASTCGDNLAHTGQVWAWLGGLAGYTETTAISQTVTIPTGFASLDFYLWIADADAGSDAADQFTVTVDGTPVFTANATEIDKYSVYTPVRVDVTGYANGASHTIMFTSTTSQQFVLFNLDDVSLASTPFPTSVTFSGNAGVASGILQYHTDSSFKKVTANGSGNYSITVPYRWSGKATPYKANYLFSPINRPYFSLQINQVSQDYTAQFCASCANIDVTMGGSPHGSYTIPPQGSRRETYPLDVGPVKVASTNAKPLIAALRDAYLVGGQVESFAQLMGLPKEQLSDTYYFPAYNNVTLDGQLRFGNVDTAATTVTVTIGGVNRGTYPLQPNQSHRVNYALDSGPVVIKSSNGAKIIAALRDAYLSNGQVESFVQLMGLPKEQLSDTYYFPAYNNLTLDGQLRFGNVDTVATNVTVTIGGVDRGTYILQPNQSHRVSYPLDTGPVVIKSSNGAKIIAALRDAYLINGKVESFAQLMGLPAQALSDTYVFPAYNNVTLDGQLRFANLDSVATDVTVTIGGVLQGTYTLQPKESKRVSYPLDSGPVVLHSSNGAKIIAALRDAYLVSGQVASFVQLMGLPALSDTYYFPAYNNVTLDGQLRFGVP